MLVKKNLLGIGITSATQREILEYIVKNLEKQQKSYYITTPNPEILVYANSHSSFKSTLNNSQLALCDGVGLFWAGKVLGKPLKARVTGVDLMENLCKEVAEKPITVGFLGAGPGIAEKTAECLGKKYPGLKIGFVGGEWNQNSKLQNSRHNNVKRLASSKLASSFGTNYTLDANKLDAPPSVIDILFVAFGFPKQEEWMEKNLANLPVKIAIGVGGAFDYISGNVPRAPIIIQKMGFEWLFRLIIQPWRFKRQLSLFKFIYLLLKERVNTLHFNTNRHAGA
ncbi:WecB/TagA/CpsF family glycosyltransferase [Candidatus Microgenomates bacterium]|nr:MAG: WecB/TagA/CpsF family glycosyltransferase [Candidatus Microgenomates bacterium]